MTMKPTLEFRWDVRDIPQINRPMPEQRLFLQQLWKSDKIRNATMGDVEFSRAKFVGEIISESEWCDIPGLGIIGIKTK